MAQEHDDSDEEITPPPVRILISVDEWRAITGWMIWSIEHSEKSPLGHYLLECEGESRTWVASDGIQTVVFRCDGPAPVGLNVSGDHFSTLVNSRLLRRNSPQDAILVVEQKGDKRRQTLDSDGVTMVLPEHPGEFLDWRAQLDSVSGSPLEVGVENLLDACVSASLVPSGVDPTDVVHTWVWVENGELRLRSPWVEFPDTEVSVPIKRSVDDTVPVLLNIKRFISLLSPITEDRCTLRLPPTDPMCLVSVRADSYEALLQPVDRWGEERHRLEELLQAFLNVESVSADDDGDYPVTTPEGHEVWVRMVTDVWPVTVQVFSVLAQPVEASPGLFEELNSINASASHVKVIWAADAVMAEVELVAESIDLAELRNALEVVRRTAERYYDVLNAFFRSPNSQEG